VTLEEEDFTTARAGRVYVARLIPGVTGDCDGGGPWSTWLEVDGVRVPGGGVSGVPDQTALRGFTLAGVTPRLEAGEHTTTVKVACGPGQTVGTSDPGLFGQLTWIVLG
jgi:hypothetical protein